MGWNGAGVVTRTDGVRTGSNLFEQQLAADIDVRADLLDAHANDLVGAIEDTLNRNGENAMAANLPMGGNKLTGMAVGTARTDSVTLGQVQDGAFLWGDVSTGQNVVNISMSPPITAYTNGMVVRFQKNTAANTSDVNININSIGEVDLRKTLTGQIPAGELPANAIVEAVYITAQNAFVALSGLAPEVSLGRGYIGGLQLSQDTDADHDITIAAGEARDDGDSANIVLASAITKQIDAAWAVGTDAGGLDTGSVAINTWYHLHAIKRLDTGVVDALFSLSATSPTLPTNYDVSRRIGAVLTDGSANIIAFFQDGDRFLWDVPVRDLNGEVVGTTAELHALSVPPSTRPVAAITSSNTVALAFVLITAPEQTDTAASGAVHNLQSPDRDNGAFNGSIFDGTLKADSSSQLRLRASANVDVDAVTLGWIDRRGRDA